MQFGGIMLHRELQNLEALGLSRLEVITTATGTGAKALGLEMQMRNDSRQVCRADLVILNRDPLEDLARLARYLRRAEGRRSCLGQWPCSPCSSDACRDSVNQTNSCGIIHGPSHVSRPAG